MIKPMDKQIRRGQKAFHCPSCETEINLKYKHFDSGHKGGRYEAFVAEQFSMAMYKKSKVLTKCPGSGGWATFWPFDVYPNEVDFRVFPFGVECKHRKGWSLSEIIYEKRSKPGKKRKADKFILDWWDTVNQDCQKYEEKLGSKIPILVLRKDTERGDLAIVKPTFYGMLDNQQCYLKNDELCVVSLVSLLDYLKRREW